MGSISTFREFSKRGSFPPESVLELLNFERLNRRNAGNGAHPFTSSEPVLSLIEGTSG